MNALQIPHQHEESQVHGGPLDAAQRHRKTTDQRVSNARAVQLSANLIDDAQKIHCPGRGINSVEYGARTS
ncbi:MAG: hypothetical protein Kow0020_09590 [Wenzhouxiangellaceae bacterium]